MRWRWHRRVDSHYTVKVHADVADAEAALKRLTAAAERFQERSQVVFRYDGQLSQTNVEAIKAQAERDSDRKFFAESAKPDVKLVGDEDGLTDFEREVSEYLVAAVNAFGALDRRHPDELRAFVDGIHACQHQLICRIVQRAYPKAWPVKRPE